MSPRDRTYYRTRPTDELERARANVEDMSTRADTMEAALADAFHLQEIDAVLRERGWFQGDGTDSITTHENSVDWGGE